MPITLTNSLGGHKQAFIPEDSQHVRMYVCGPTVYNYAHIGNARPAVVFDVLARRLRRDFPKLSYVRNLTDVDDKINAASLSSGVPIGAITARYTEAYHADMEALGVRPPDVEPKVTDHIPQIIALIEALIAKGHAYVASDHVLFHVPSFPQYGALSRRSVDEMIAGARIEVAPYKRHPADFVLWKPSSAELPGWESPWRRGRPGWHIECSAMILEHLGEQIDIHGGGQDLIFPHHENEIAQGTKANYWIHNGFVTVDGQKMSKSLGNVLLVRDLLAKAPGEAIRFALLSAHYRQPLDWSEETLKRAERSLDRLYGTLQALDDITPSDSADLYLAPFNTAIDDDLNTPAAFAELFRLERMARQEPDPSVRSNLKRALLDAGQTLGLLDQQPDAWLARKLADNDVLDAALVADLVSKRETARSAKDFARADEIRAELGAMGVTVEDRPDRSIWWRS